MIAVNDYIKILLKKNKLTLSEFSRRINNIKQQIGIDNKTTRQNISNYLNEVDDKHVLRPKQLCIWEKALNVPAGTLTSMVKPPGSKNGLIELNKLMKEVEKIK